MIKKIKGVIIMDKEKVLKDYAAVGINSQSGLYNFIINNDKVVLNGIDYDLSKSNEVMEFMVPFLEALDFEVTRLYLEKEKDGVTIKNHWFVAFNSGLKFYYYETVIDEIKGKYSFGSYNNLTTFVVTKLINFFEKNNDSTLNEKYTLREIKPLDNFNLSDNIKQSHEGLEVLVWSDLAGNFSYEQNIPEVMQREEIPKRKKKSTNFGLFLVGFAFTLVICIGILWFLASLYYGNK